MKRILDVLKEPIGSTGINALAIIGFTLMVAGAVASVLANRCGERRKTILKLASLFTAILGATVVIAFGKNV